MASAPEKPNSTVAVNKDGSWDLVFYELGKYDVI